MNEPAVKLDSPATVADLDAIPEESRRHELIEGTIVGKGAASGEHGATQLKVGSWVDPYHRRPGGQWPGGWWFAAEVEVVFDSGTVLRPDVVGWRRDRVPERPRGARIEVRPDWVCEILSTKRASDLARKKRIYHRHEVPHYWIIDPEEVTLSVNRYSREGYVEILSAERGDRVRAEPFEALELDVAVLCGDDEEG